MAPVVQLGLAGLLTLVTIAIHGSCTAAAFRLYGALHPRHWATRSLLTKVLATSAVVLVLMLASVAEAWVWSLAYRISGAIASAEEALYFSIVTYTTLGYGDITLEQGWRLLASLQAAAGIVVFGWSTAIVIAVVQRIASLGGDVAE